MPSHVVPNPQPGFTLLAKPTGAACNLSCTYCFYLAKQQLYPESRWRMSDTVLEEYIHQLLASQPCGEVTIAWQGGEPTLMGLDFFRRSITLVKKYKKPTQRVAFSLQTNGTLLDDEWCNFFKQQRFLIGISIDGTPEMHDTYRVNKAGRGSFDQVRRGWELLQKRQVESNILCAVHRANVSHPLKLYHFFKDTLHASYIQFIPIVERLNNRSGLPQSSGEAIQRAGPVSECSVRSEEYGRFLVEIFNEWVHRDVGTVFIQGFEASLASWCGLPASVCIFQEVCGGSLILEHNGDLYSCDHFVDPDHRLGNILEKPMSELVSTSRQRQFGLDKREGLPGECQRCDVLFACQGECPRNRFVKTEQGEGQELNYLCPSYKLFYHHIDQPMRLLAGLVRRGQPASDIMHMV